MWNRWPSPSHLNQRNSYPPPPPFSSSSYLVKFSIKGDQECLPVTGTSLAETLRTLGRQGYKAKLESEPRLVALASGGQGEVRCADLCEWSDRRSIMTVLHSSSIPLLPIVYSGWGWGHRRPPGSQAAPARDSAHIEQTKMQSQGQVFPKYVLEFLLNAYIQQHTRALSNSPLGVVTTVWMWWQQHVWDVAVWGKAVWGWDWIWISGGTLHMVGLRLRSLPRGSS
jgi:hypothetical protein